MARKTTQTPANARYSYGEVESALAAVFGVDPAGQRGWFRGRVQHLRRLQLVADSPGRGRTIEYSLEDADKWLLAIELEHFGGDPKKVVDLIKGGWKRPAASKLSALEAFRRFEARFADVIEVARAGHPDGDIIVYIEFGPMPAACPIISYSTMAGMQFTFLPQIGAGRIRASVFNLSALLRQFDAALAASAAGELAPPPQPPPGSLAAAIIRAAKVARGELPSLAKRRRKKK